MSNVLKDIRILIAEDNTVMREGLTQLLASHGASCIQAATGQSAYDVYHKEKPDFCILDIMMEDFDGFQLCAAIRGENPEVPILFLSARRTPVDRITGLDIGADDYMVKPFDPNELVARIRSIMRRFSHHNLDRKFSAIVDGCLIMGDLLVFPGQMKAERAGVEIALTKREIRILQLLFIKRDQVTTRDALLDFCWGLDHLPNSRVLDQAVAALRKKIEVDPTDPKIILTIRGGGYRFDT